MLAVPAAILLLRAIRAYYDRLDASLADAGPFTIDETDPPTLVIAVEGRSRMSDRALQLAVTLSPDVIAVHLMQLAGPEVEDHFSAIERK